MPTAMIDILVGNDDHQALFIAFVTDTEFELPRPSQYTTFAVRGCQDNVRNALRMVEEIINKNRDSGSPPYTFITDPNKVGYIFDCKSQ